MRLASCFADRMNMPRAEPSPVFLHEQDPLAVTNSETSKRAIEQPNAGKRIPKKKPKSAKTSGISWRVCLVS